MKRPQFEFRPNRRLKLHQQAWEYLERVPAGQKNEYLVQAILCLESQKGLEKTLRKVLTDPSVAVKGESLQKKQTEVPDEMLGFMDGNVDVAVMEKGICYV